MSQKNDAELVVRRSCRARKVNSRFADDQLEGTIKKFVSGISTNQPSVTGVGKDSTAAVKRNLKLNKLTKDAVSEHKGSSIESFPISKTDEIISNGLLQLLPNDISNHETICVSKNELVEPISILPSSLDKKRKHNQSEIKASKKKFISGSRKSVRKSVHDNCINEGSLNSLNSLNQFTESNKHLEDDFCKALDAKIQIFKNDATFDDVDHTMSGAGGSSQFNKVIDVSQTNSEYINSSCLMNQKMNSSLSVEYEIEPCEDTSLRNFRKKKLTNCTDEEEISYDESEVLESSQSSCFFLDSESDETVARKSKNHVFDGEQTGFSVESQPNTVGVLKVGKNVDENSATSVPLVESSSNLFANSFESVKPNDLLDMETNIDGDQVNQYNLLNISSKLQKIKSCSKDNNFDENSDATIIPHGRPKHGRKMQRKHFGMDRSDDNISSCSVDEIVNHIDGVEGKMGVYVEEKDISVDFSETLQNVIKCDADIDLLQKGVDCEDAKVIMAVSQTNIAVMNKVGATEQNIAAINIFVKASELETHLQLLDGENLTENVLVKTVHSDINDDKLYVDDYNSRQRSRIRDSKRDRRTGSLRRNFLETKQCKGTSRDGSDDDQARKRRHSHDRSARNRKEKNHENMTKRKHFSSCEQGQSTDIAVTIKVENESQDEKDITIETISNAVRMCETSHEIPTSMKTEEQNECSEISATVSEGKYCLHDFSFDGFLPNLDDKDIDCDENNEIKVNKNIVQSLTEEEKSNNEIKVMEGDSSVKDNCKVEIKLEVENNEEELRIKLDEEKRNKEEVARRLKMFTHLDMNIYIDTRKKRKRNKEMRRMLCDCTLSQEELEQNEVGCGEDCLNRLLMIECGSRCALNNYCTNRQFQQRKYAPVEVFSTPNKGCGIRALERISPGTFIMEYVGEVFDTREFKRRQQEYAKDSNAHFYFMSLRSDELIDATRSGNISRFINHSCDPNAETQKWTVNGDLRVGFFANKWIEHGEEINFDYRLERYGREAQKCYCGSPICRGWLGESPDEKTKEEKDEERRKEEKDRRRREEKKTALRFDDSVLEEEIEKLSCRCLRNRDDTLTLCRLMVRCENSDLRMLLLMCLMKSQPACKMLFIDYHGLKLLWSWMAHITNDVTFIRLKIKILRTLGALPINNRTQLAENKIDDIVLRWNEECRLLVKNACEEFVSTEIEQIETENGGVPAKNDIEVKKLEDGEANNIEMKDNEANNIVNETIDSDASSQMPNNSAKLEEETKTVYSCISSADWNSEDSINKENEFEKLTLEITESAASESKESAVSNTKESNESSLTSASSSSRPSRSLEVLFAANSNVTKTSTCDLTMNEDNEQDIEKLQLMLQHLATQLLQSWDGLKEALQRIPKKEMMKRHEREVERGYRSYLEKTGVLDKRERGKERESYSNYKVPSWVTSEQRDISRRHKEDTSPFNTYSPLTSDKYSPRSRLSKVEHRKRFEMLIKKEEEVKRQIQEEEFLRLHHEHVNKCFALGLDPNLIPFCDSSGNAWYWDSEAGNWVHMGDAGDGMIPSLNDISIDDLTVSPFLPPFTPLGPSSTPLYVDPFDPSNIPLPGETPPTPQTPPPPDTPPIPLPLVLVLPPGWKFLKAPSGHLFFYHIKKGTSRWTPPSAEEHDMLVAQWAQEQQEGSDGSDEESSNDDDDDESESEEFSSESEEDEAKKEDFSSIVVEENDGEKMVRHLRGRKRRPEALVQERVISPICEVDRDVARRERKEAKERAKVEARKERKAEEGELRKEEGGKVKEEEGIKEVTTVKEKKIRGREKNKIKVSAVSDNCEAARKIKESFRCKMATFIVQVLNFYRQKDCTQGHISNTEDFKYLARKLTHFVMVKELKQLQSIDQLHCTSSVQHKTKDFVRKYMSKYGSEFQRDPNDTKEY